ncbi:MAG: AAA family ATPase [Planctomycetota bacterium]|jgi:predicted ATPase|nr:AAA family ATPase [Planctomycetota bacterium]
MLHTLAIHGYRSLREVALKIGSLNLITGPNGSGKSNIYRSIRLLASAAEGELIRALAKEGGLQSTLWAGPENISREMEQGNVPIQGTKRKNPISLKLGFSADDFTYTVDLGLPIYDPNVNNEQASAFRFDPTIKRECLWTGPIMKPKALIVDRKGQNITCRDSDGQWQEVNLQLPGQLSMMTEYADPFHAPELVLLRNTIRSWRFYDHFRTDMDSPARRTEVGTFTPSLRADGSDLAAALQTILEIGDSETLHQTVQDAFAGTQLFVQPVGNHLQVQLQQSGMLRCLNASELSDGTLRFLLLVAALLTPRPPELMVLNEPETSLHPDLLPALGRLIAHYAENQQIIVVTHARPLVEQLIGLQNCQHHELVKRFGQTEVQGMGILDRPDWKWPAR